MSLQSFVDTVKTDLEDAVEWGEEKVEQGVSVVWGAAQTVFKGEVPAIAGQVLTSFEAFAATEAGLLLKGTDLATLQAAFLNWIETEVPTLLADAQSLGSDLLQSILGLARAKAAAA